MTASKDILALLSRIGQRICRGPYAQESGGEKEIDWAELTDCLMQLAEHLSLPNLSLYVPLRIDGSAEMPLSFVCGRTEEGLVLSRSVSGGDHHGHKVDYEQSRERSLLLAAEPDHLLQLSLGEPIELGEEQVQVLKGRSQPLPRMRLGGRPTSVHGLLVPVAGGPSAPKPQSRILGLLLLVCQPCERGSQSLSQLKAAANIFAALVAPVLSSSQGAPRIDEPPAISEMSRRLTAELWLRQAICKLHLSLDRDCILQSLVDSLGRGLRPSRCLVVRTSPGTPELVCHEYEDPDLSPLGLGRTNQFHLFAVQLLRHRCTAYGDVSELLAAGAITDEQYDVLCFGGIVSLAGVPLYCQDQLFGVVVLVDAQKRLWDKTELDGLDTLVSQASIALTHSATYEESQHQLFHLSLISNVTEQLTSALDMVSHLPRVGRPEERGVPETVETASLSARELEVLRLISSGYANKEIAQRLFLTESTVELHASRIRKKLKLKSRTALVKYACDKGIV
ncbi:MAG: GAF domain-containing protein [Candidatus Melainabacteria bacterium]|nr:GAF domain-containing protein [Candidatus Melainabacteria bacterium]